MKKLIDLRCYVAIGKNNYVDTSNWNHIQYIEVNESKTECVLKTWEEAYEAVKNNRIRNATIGLTFFRKRETIELYLGDSFSNFVMTKKTFVPIHVKWEWQEVDENYTIKNLANLLPANQFCEWLKNKGITQIDSF